MTTLTYAWFLSIKPMNLVQHSLTTSELEDSNLPRHYHAMCYSRVCSISCEFPVFKSISYKSEFEICHIAYKTYNKLHLLLYYTQSTDTVHTTLKRSSVICYLSHLKGTLLALIERLVHQRQTNLSVDLLQVHPHPKHQE
jgi:hypothetical protein